MRRIRCIYIKSDVNCDYIYNMPFIILLKLSTILLKCHYNTHYIIFDSLNYDNDIEFV